MGQSKKLLDFHFGLASVARPSFWLLAQIFQGGCISLPGKKSLWKLTVLFQCPKQEPESLPRKKSYSARKKRKKRRKEKKRKEEKRREEKRREEKRREEKRKEKKRKK